jgi:L-threonylcarbamoyladenylate synthase
LPGEGGLAPTVRVDPADPDQRILERAWGVLASGGLLIYPTDTLYALGGLASKGEAAEAVRAAKGREGEKPLPVIASDLPQVKSLCEEWPASAARLAAAFWPGPLTLVLRAEGSLPSELTRGTVAVRIPAHALARALCRFGPLISTSANRSGEAPGLTCAEAVGAVGRSAQLALNGGDGTPVPSTILDLTGEVPVERRPGAVAWDAIRRVLQEGGS